MFSILIFLNYWINPILIFLNYWIVHSAAQQPMVTSTHHNIGDTFNITCDVTRFADLKLIPEHDYLAALSLVRKTFTAPADVQIAVYSPFTTYTVNGKATNFLIQHNPRNQWQFEHARSAIRTAIYVIVTAVNFQCSDAGEYKCSALLPNGEHVFNSPVNITVKAPISDHSVKSNRHNGNDSYSSTNYVEENITLTCTVTGPPSLLITWKQTAKDSAKENLSTGEISNNITTIVSTGCEVSHHTSELEFQLQESDDGNTYYCIVSNDNGEQSRENFTICTFPILPQQRIVASTHHYAGDTFNITCDVTKFPGFKVIPDQDYLAGLSLIRKESIQSGFSHIADYKPFSPVKHNNDNLPGQWLVQYSGGENSTIPNRQTIRIIVTAVDFQCSDSGIYKCKAELPNGEVVFSRSVKITVKAPISDHAININRHNGNDSYSSTNYVEENITLTCTVTGPPSLLITWKQTANDSAKENSTTGEISFNSTSPSIVSTGCELNHYSSKLEVQLQETDDGNTYYCIVSNDTGEQSIVNFTLRIIPSVKSTSRPKPQPEPQPGPHPEPQPEPQPEPEPEPRPKPRPESQPADTGFGTIFSGVLVFVASATALVYYLVIKKKHRGSQDTTTNVETTDNDQIVPTSFYTAPQKTTTKKSDDSVSI